MHHSTLRAIEIYKPILPEIIKRRNMGLTFLQIANYLNGTGKKTARGKKFYPMTVRLILEREQLKTA